MFKYYAHIQNDELIDATATQYLDEGILNVEVPYEVYAEIDKYMWDGSNVVLDPNYEEEQAQKEKERIQELYMTRSDFFDGTIKAFGLDSDDLLLIIANVLNNIGIPEIEEKVALNNFRNALNFYRKHTLFTLLSGRPIPISSSESIFITKEQWDRFFDETNKRNPLAYKELLPQPEEP